MVQHSSRDVLLHPLQKICQKKITCKRLKSFVKESENWNLFSINQTIRLSHNMKWSLLIRAINKKETRESVCTLLVRNQSMMMSSQQRLSHQEKERFVQMARMKEMNAVRQQKRRSYRQRDNNVISDITCDTAIVTAYT